MPSIHPLATLSPPCTSRTWHSAPHPTLPLLATSCSDKTARIYSLQSLALDSTVSGGHKRSIRSCAWKPNSLGESVLVTGSFDASAGIWRRWEEGSAVANAKAHRAETDFTKGLAGGDEDAEDEDEDDWRFTVVLEGHESEIKSVAFSPTSPLLATCGRDKSVWIWEELPKDEFETVAVLQDHEGDVKCVAWHPGEELLASGSYDDCVRLWKEDQQGDWECCTLLNNHNGTVWWVEFEGTEKVGALTHGGDANEGRQKLLKDREQAGPRLISCSDDISIRIWQRVPKEKKEKQEQQLMGTGRMPTIWSNSDFKEEWVEEVQLPQVHERPILAVSWSRKSGRVASTGSDGRIVVYEERWRDAKDANGDSEMTNGAQANGSEGQATRLTEWAVLADVENAHDVFEVNHIVWAPRADKGKRWDGEEVLVSTGDDGEVKVWTFDP